MAATAAEGTGRDGPAPAPPSAGGRKADSKTPNLCRLFRALDRAPVPFSCFGRSESPPTLSVGIDALVAASRETDRESKRRFVLAKDLESRGIEVKFDRLDGVLDDISESLLQGRKLDAKLEVINIEHPGDSQGTRQMAKIGDRHVAFLFVTASGDWKNADADGGDVILERREEGCRGRTWEGRGQPGTYAAWYPGESTRTTALKGQEGSYRVTLAYSVHIRGSEKREASSADNIPWITQAESDLSCLTPDVGKIVVSYLGSQELRGLALSCRQLRDLAHLGDVMTKMVAECREELIAFRRGDDGTEKFNLAIPLQWSYHDGINLRCWEYWLFGLDYILYQAFQRVFPGGVICRRAVIRCTDGKIDAANVQIVQSATEVNSFPPYEEDVQQLISAHRGRDYSLPPGKKWTREAWDAMLRISDALLSQCMDVMTETHIVWPFFCTRVIIEKNYLRGIVNRLEPDEGTEMRSVDSDEDSSLYFYESSCLIVRPGPATDKSQEEGLKNNEVWVGPAWIED